MKSGNILMDEQGNCKLADFGVSAQKEESAQNKTVVGTPLWMAPEVLNSSAYDEGADIWSLGITAIEMAQTKPPHAEETNVFGAIDLILKGDPPKLKEPEKWSKDFNDFIALCVQKKPSDRPTAKQLLDTPFIKKVPENNGIVLGLLKQLGKVKDETPAPRRESAGTVIVGNGAKDNIIEKKNVRKSANASEMTIISAPTPVNHDDDDNKTTQQLKEVIQIYRTALDAEKKRAEEERQKWEEEKKKRKKINKKLKTLQKAAAEGGNNNGERPASPKPAPDLKSIPTSDPNQLKKLSQDDLIKKIKLLEAQNRALIQGREQADATIKILLEEQKRKKS